MNWLELKSSPIGTEQQLRAKLARVQWTALAVGLIAMAVCVLFALMGESQRESFDRSYLVAYFLWLGVALGSGGAVMIHNLTSGKWGLAVRRVMGAANGNMPLMALLALPLAWAAGNHHLYGWAGSPFVPDPHLGAHKARLLAPRWVLFRGMIYLAIWIATSVMIRVGSRRVEQTRSYAQVRLFAGLSAFGLILYALTLTGAVVDWVMSLTPDWYSTVFTLTFLMGQMLSGFCFAAVAGGWMIRYEPVHGKISADQFNDVGSFMFAFMVLWAYMAFSQLLISWMGNLKSEMAYYVHRNSGGWLIVGILLILLQFAAPFLLLLFKPIKRKPSALLWVAVGILVMRWIDLMYMIKPAFPTRQFSWTDPVLAIGIGGLFVSAFVRTLKRGRLAPPPLVDEYTAVEAKEIYGRVAGEAAS